MPLFLFLLIIFSWLFGTPEGQMLLDIVFGIPLIVVVIVVVVGFLVSSFQESKRKNIERQESEKRRQQEKEKEEARLAETRKREEDFNRAVRAGTDVCMKCKSINPKRCSHCRNCISCWNTRSRRYDHLCSGCGQGVAARECAYAESRGKDVCWICLTSKPLRCYCGNCTICYPGGGNECSVHYDDD